MFTENLHQGSIHVLEFKMASEEIIVIYYLITPLVSSSFSGNTIASEKIQNQLTLLFKSRNINILT
jgi:hypothetical protein